MTALRTSLRLNGAVNSANGIPTIVGNGQGNTSSTNSAVSSPNCDDDNDGVLNSVDICDGFDDNDDNDQDGVPDGCDVDDDNDGILDNLEKDSHILENFESGSTTTTKTSGHDNYNFFSAQPIQPLELVVVCIILI